MCLTSRQDNLKQRRLTALGLVALSSGLMLFVFAHPSAAFARNFVHAIGGFLMGISLAINLNTVRFIRR